ncbi:MAG: amidase [Chloroflexi bacterium]|nr:amidase [Chloroflexota bacterium]
MRAGTLSPVALVEALLARIAAREPHLQAWVCVDRDGALAEARAAERTWREGRAGPLCGLPVGVKDVIIARGLPTAGGFAPFRDFQPDFDATCVARLRAAGALVLGKVATTQFAGRDPTPTRNPWHAERTASGSSAGSAVAVAARMVPVALGTQTGGSVIRPAGYMGVVGFTPTAGRISRHGLLPRAFSFDTVGVMSRCVADAALLYPVMAGPDRHDATTLFRRRPPPVVLAEPPAPRLVLLEDFLDRAAPAVAAHLAATVGRLAAAGAVVRRARLPVALDVLIAIHTVILLVEAAASQAQLYPRYQEHYAPGLRAQIEIGAALPGLVYVQAQRLRRRVRARMARLVRGIDALVLPATSDLAPDRSTIGNNLCQAPWTVLGWPAATVPSGLSAEGLPFGLQLVGAPFREGRLLSIAQWVERRVPPMPAPPAFGQGASRGPV